MTSTLGKLALLGIIIGLPLPTIVTAQEPVDEESEKRRYTVEFVIFRYAEDVGVGTEIFPPEEPSPEDPSPLAGDYGEEGPIFTDVAIVAPSEAGAEPPVRDEAGEDPKTPDEIERQRSRLDLVISLRDALTLENVLDRLERLDVYEPLLYGGWTQATLPKEETEPLELGLFGDLPPGLEGSFTLYLGRFLHLVVDLTLDVTAGDPQAPDAAPAFSFGDSRFGFDRDPFRPEGRVLLRLNEDRIMKNGEIRYFDHPKFGVIAKVMRIEEPAETEEDAVTPLVGGLRE